MLLIVPKGWEPMAEITVEESWRQIRVLIDRADQAVEDGRSADAVEDLRAVLAHPCAHHQVLTCEVLDAIHQAWRHAGRYDDAIAAKREAITAGYRSVPDPETDIAECLLEAGRRAEADALFATLLERDPDDVWLYNAAAYSYADVDTATSLRWALDGIEVALGTGDPDQVVMQLLELAEVAWQQLDEPVDQDLVDTVERFCEQWTPVASRRLWGEVPPSEDRPCAHCGYQPETSRAELDEPARRNRLPGPVTLAVGWFPAEQWSGARERWPALFDDLPADHLAYCHTTEARIKRIARQGPGHRLHVTAMTIDGLMSHAEESGHDPGSREARSSYASALLEAGEAVVWPPGRNQPCWCGSPRKYKKCCGPVPAAEDDAS